ncbi:ABC transporter ATP-binding protein [Calidifontibacter sp. DB0510]|uniref:ABC transporter ATP-binding protein n=1 Tax=Metallococcus carri TaxID=1656884 RepID=A0A967B1X5_9MICO|nr:ATP-binding cassette domain-containing protein [Metallococcus carri]NHN56008.1 ABC transporter ATP-binding protein [Metallococcus carri]NOP37535.1 ABC transporter ATP-binding protein [Calidifontibacter sp. DB2511S]
MSDGLALDNVSVTYRQPGGRRLRAVHDVSLAIEPGEVVGLVGESGCGKSTLARAICGLESLSSGTASFEGHPITRLGLRRRPTPLLRAQMVFQNPYASLNPRRRIGAQLEDGRRIHPGRAPSVVELLDQVGLESSAAQRFPHEFSGGQRQRIAIARAVATGPDLLIGDEPIASLDASLQARIATLMRSVALDAGASLLFISHDLSVVRLIADRMVVMRAGEIVEAGPTEQVWSGPQQAYTKRLLAAIPKADGRGELPQLLP